MQANASRREAYQLIHEGILAFGRAERQGMRIDIDYCEKKKNFLTRKIKHLKTQLEETKFYRRWEHIYGAKTNIQSNLQLAKILYQVMKLTPPKQTSKGEQGSTDEESLLQLDVPELQKLLEIRKLTKVRDTYLDAFVREQVDGVLHTFFNLHTVKTYRSSSSDPNFQNVPKRDVESMRLCRQAIYPRPGHQLLAIDFSSAEVRVACCYTEDPKLIDDTLHGDMHGDMAIELYMLDGLDKHHAGEKNLRQGGKNSFVFPEFYGDYYGNCAVGLLRWAKMASLRDDTPALIHLSNKGLIQLDRNGEVKNSDKFLKHVQNVEDQFWNVRYKVYTKWKKKWWEDYQRRGYIEMFTGFKCGGVMTRNECLNIPIQGSAFHCLLWSFIRVDQIAYEEENWDSKPIGQIHDEMILDTHPEELEHVGKTVRRVTCEELPAHWKWIIIPMEVEADCCEVDGSWADKHSYELN
jgi:DNA polymerase I